MITYAYLPQLAFSVSLTLVANKISDLETGSEVWIVCKKIHACFVKFCRNLHTLRCLTKKYVTFYKVLNKYMFCTSL